MKARRWQQASYSQCSCLLPGDSTRTLQKFPRVMAQSHLQPAWHHMGTSVKQNTGERRNDALVWMSEMSAASGWPTDKRRNILHQLAMESLLQLKIGTCVFKSIQAKTVVPSLLVYTACVVWPAIFPDWQDTYLSW